MSDWTLTSYVERDLPYRKEEISILQDLVNHMREIIRLKSELESCKKTLEMIPQEKLSEALLLLPAKDAKSIARLDESLAKCEEMIAWDNDFYDEVTKRISWTKSQIDNYIRSARPRKSSEIEKLENLKIENSALENISKQLDFEFRALRYFGNGRVIFSGKM